MLRKGFWFIGLVLIQFIAVGLLVMAYAQPGDPGRFTWINDVGVRARTMLTDAPKAVINKVKGVWDTIPGHTGPTIGSVDFTTGTARATGYGVMPTNAASVAQGQLLALDAAQLDAERNLVATLAGAGVRVERVSDKHVEEKYHVEETAQGRLLGAKIVDTRFKTDGAVEVDVEVKIVKE